MNAYSGGADIRERTFRFAVRIIRVCQHLDVSHGVSCSLGRQLIRSGTAIGANLEEARAGHSRAEFAAKCAIALKEAHETVYWLRLIGEADSSMQSRLQALVLECSEITRILGAIIVATRKRGTK